MGLNTTLLLSQTGCHLTKTDNFCFCGVMLAKLVLALKMNYHNVASDLGLHISTVSNSKGTRLILVKITSLIHIHIKYYVICRPPDKRV